MRCRTYQHHMTSTPGDLLKFVSSDRLQWLAENRDGASCSLEGGAAGAQLPSVAVVSSSELPSSTAPTSAQRLRSVGKNKPSSRSKKLDDHDERGHETTEDQANHSSSCAVGGEGAAPAPPTDFFYTRTPPEEEFLWKKEINHPTSLEREPTSAAPVLQFLDGGGGQNPAASASSSESPVGTNEGVLPPAEEWSRLRLRLKHVTTERDALRKSLSIQRRENNVLRAQLHISLEEQFAAAAAADSHSHLDEDVVSTLLYETEPPRWILQEPNEEDPSAGRSVRSSGEFFLKIVSSWVLK